MKVHEFESRLVHDKPFAPAEIDKLKNLPKDFTRKHLDHTQDIKFMKEDGSDKIRPVTCNNAQ